MSNHFVVWTSASKKGSKYGAHYRNVAILECRDGMTPTRIDTRDPAVIRIHRHFGAVHVGATHKSAYYKTCEYAERIAGQLNAPAAIEAGVLPDVLA